MDVTRPRCKKSAVTWIGVYVSQERAHTLTEATKGGELLRPSGCKQGIRRREQALSVDGN